MKVDFEEKPGTGNTYIKGNTYINIGTVQNYNPNATTVINNNYGMRVQSQGGSQDEEVDKDEIKSHILSYVRKLKEKSLVSEDWERSYEVLWNDILELEAVQAAVYDHGHQHGTDFNRVLVAAIINILRDKGVYVKCSNVSMAEALERNRDHHVRSEVAKTPPKEVEAAVKQLLQDKKYKK